MGNFLTLLAWKGFSILGHFHCALGLCVEIQNGNDLRSVEVPYVPSLIFESNMYHNQSTGFINQLCHVPRLFQSINFASNKESIYFAKLLKCNAYAFVSDLNAIFSSISCLFSNFIVLTIA